MPGAILPPFASPSGPELSLEGVIDAFLEGRRTGFSDSLHIENDTLLAQRMITLAARMGPRSVLIRVDIPADVLELRSQVVDHLSAQGLFEVEADSRLGDIAAIQVTGIRGSVWDLWGDDPVRSRSDLERCVLGTDGLAPEAMTIQLSDSSGDDSATGMTLEDLLGNDFEDGEKQ